MNKMNLKKLASALVALCLMLTLCGLAETTEGMSFTAAAAILCNPGDTLDAAAMLVNPASDLTYTTSDELVATVDEAGVVTAVGDGVATIVAVSASDTSVYAYMDVAVCNYLTTFAGSKHVEAMNCDIDIELTFNEDGTYHYYRGPMTVAIDGGGEMAAMEDDGTYAFDGTQFVFTSETFGEFTMLFTMVEGNAVLQGKIPTGGPSTDMELTRVIVVDSVTEPAAE